MSNQEPPVLVPDDERPYNTLLSEWQSRSRTLGRAEASHPVTLRRVMADLDARGLSEAGDAIQSLVWDAEIARQREQFLIEHALSQLKALVIEYLEALEGDDANHVGYLWSQLAPLLEAAPGHLNDVRDQRVELIRALKEAADLVDRNLEDDHMSMRDTASHWRVHGIVHAALAAVGERP